MKKFVSLLMFSLMIASTSIFAQQQNQQQGRQKAANLTPEQRMDLNVKRMTKELMLNDSQTAKFTPLYINYLTALKELAPEKKMEKGVELTDAQEMKAMKESFAKRRKMIDTEEKYFNDFSKFLTAGQLKKVFRHGNPMMMNGKRMFNKTSNNMMKNRLAKKMQTVNK